MSYSNNDLIRDLYLSKEGKGTEKSEAFVRLAVVKRGEDPDLFFSDEAKEIRKKKMKEKAEARVLWFLSMIISALLSWSALCNSHYIGMFLLLFWGLISFIGWIESSASF